MRPSLRFASRWMCNRLLGALPEETQIWARAIRAEVEHIPNDSAAFLFALDAIRGVALLMLSHALFAKMAHLKRFFSIAHSGIAQMINQTSDSAKVRKVGTSCAIAAVSLGLAYLFAAGAPMHMLAINAGALVLGMATMMLLSRVPALPAYGREIVTLAMACALLLTALSGTAVESASRWVVLGPLVVQPSLILLPVIVLTFARDRGPIATAGMLITALAMALQPDRAMAAVLMSSLMALAITRRDRFVLVALAASVAAFFVAMMAPDKLPAVPHVDQVLYKAFDVHLLAGVAVVSGAALLLVPALYGLRVRSLDRTQCMTFGAIWLSVILAAAFGNYPTPVVGYGGSAILGYLFSLAALQAAPEQMAARPAARTEKSSQSGNVNLSFAHHQHA